MKSKKIIVNLLPYSTKMAGTGYFFIRLFNELLKIDSKNKYELHVSNHIDLIEVFRKFENVVIVFHKLPNSKVARVLFEQFIFPFKIKGDVFFSPSVAIPFLFQFSAKKYITTIHDITPFIFKKYSLIQQFYVKSITRICAYRSDKIITVSKNSQLDIIKLFKIRTEKISIVYNFLSSDSLLEKFELNKSEYFLTVSTVQPGKNLFRLIEAFALFLNDFNHYKLYIIGDLGWHYEGLLKLVEKYKIGRSVIFMGYVSEIKLKKMYLNAKALLYVSLYEGFGIPPLEAMSLGCPIVVSNISSLPEVAGEAAIYVNPYEIDSILDGMRQSLGINQFEYLTIAKNQCAKFDGKIEASRFLEILNEK